MHPRESAVEADERANVYETLSLEACAANPAPDWAYLAARQLMLQPGDAAISSVLAEIGAVAGADRAWMFEYDGDLLRFRNTHEWSREGVRSFVEDLQNTPVTMIAWLHQFLAAGEAVMINRVADLPRPARPLQVEMLRQGDESVLSVPVFHGGRLRACIGLDATAAIRRWSASEIKALFQCAELIGLARYGERDKAPEPNGSAAAFPPLIYLRRQGRTVGVELNAIVGVRSARDYAEVWLRDGTKVLDLRSLALWTGLLPPASFLRIHRTAIVNLQHVQGLDRSIGGRWQVAFRHFGETWPVSRAHRQELRQRLGI